MNELFRVVVVDDDPDTRFLARRRLERSGRFTVVAEAPDGPAGIAAATEHQPDLTLLDLRMPGGDGLEALPSIRKAAPQGTVVVLSGLPRADVEKDALEAGAAGFFPKCVEWGQLPTELLGLLEQPHGVGPTAETAFTRQLRLPAELTSGHAARQFLRETFEDWRTQRLLDDAALLTTELVNNAVVHAASALLLRVGLTSRGLRVEVTDTGAGALRRAHPELTDDSGRGLFIVDAIARSWGTSAGLDGKSVWFELDAEHDPE